jgi:uncharacterized Zn finger protein
MPKKKKQADRFSHLSWDDMEAWAGKKIVSRGKNYQLQGHVSELAVIADGSLIAWVEGTRRYATRVAMGEGGLPDSLCTCPYGLDCKHGVAVVIEYLKQIEGNQRVPKAKQDDNRLVLLEDDGWDDEDDEGAVSENTRLEITGFLKGKTKAQLVDLLHEYAENYPEIAQDLSGRKQLISGNTQRLIADLQREILRVGNETGWQNYWKSEGYTPDYSGIHKKLEALLKVGHADEVLALGRDLVTNGIRQVEESHDEGETAMEIESCLPVILNALEKAALDEADKLLWALDAVLEDQFDLCEVFAEYLHRRHPKSAWNKVSDRLLSRLKKLKSSKSIDDFHRNYERDHLSDWAIHALERCGRKDEIIPLCEAEALKTGSYSRLVDRLVEVKQYEDAEKWILKGIKATKGKWSGIASGLREKLREIRTLEKNRHAVAAIQVEAFVQRPSIQAFTDCKKICSRVKVWPKVRECLLLYLKQGELPWKNREWALPGTGLDAPAKESKDRFPMIRDLIDIAILEKKPDEVLYWYDQLSHKRFGYYGVNDHEIALSVQNHAPHRSVAIWQQKAETLIAQVKPSAYTEAAKYLRKAEAVMVREKKTGEWGQYLKALREKHIRKTRLMEILDDRRAKPIIKKRRG